jgi:hypothetical protein
MYLIFNYLEMPYTRKIVQEINTLIKSETKALKIIEEKLKTENQSLQNRKYLLLLVKASKKKQHITFLRVQKQLLTRNLHKQMIVSIGSRVQLLSTKVGEVFFVDAKNYIELIGKTIGDAVMMNNAKFLIAGVY